VLTGLDVPSADPAAEVLLLVCREEGDLVDLLEIRLETAFGGNGSTPVDWLPKVGGLLGARGPGLLVIVRRVGCS
jgi:hypothetical protein